MGLYCHSERGKCGKICVELKFLGCQGDKWHSTGSPERCFQTGATNDSNVLVKQISLS